MDEKRAKNFVSKLLDNQRLLSLAIFIVGLGYSFAVLHWSIDQRTHFSENALLPGLVNEKFPYEQDVFDNFHTLKNLLKGLTTSGHDLTPHALEYLRLQFEANGLETYVQNFTLEKGPLNAKKIAGSNIVGIARSSRGYSNEAIVVALPFGEKNFAALALMLALAKFCTEQVYWAKDILFILVEHKQIGMLSWLNAYHERSNSMLKSSELSAHSGSIQAAVILDFDLLLTDPTKISRADIGINMLNGKLPNLDFVNLAITLLEKHGILPTIYGQDEFWSADMNENLWRHAKTASFALSDQSESRPVGLHSVFGSFGVEALTLKLGFSPVDGERSLPKMALVLEGILRSVNNLLENFHASYFFYILFSTHNFVSISVYIPIIGIILAALLIKVYAVWAELYSTNEDENQSSTITKFSKETVDYSYVFLVIFVSHAVGLLLRFLFDLCEFLQFGNYLEQNFLSVCITTVLIAVTVLRMLNQSFRPILAILPENCSPSANFLFGLSILQFALMLGVFSLLNFGLALYTCFLVVPLLIAVKPSLNKFQRSINTILALLLNPFVFIALISCAYSWVFKQHAENAMGNITVIEIYENLNILVSRLAFDCYLFSSWHYTLLTVGIVPMWICLWISISVA